MFQGSTGGAQAQRDMQVDFGRGDMHGLTLQQENQLGPRSVAAVTQPAIGCSGKQGKITLVHYLAVVVDLRLGDAVERVDK